MKRVSLAWVHCEGVEKLCEDHKVENLYENIGAWLVVSAYCRGLKGNNVSLSQTLGKDWGCSSRLILKGRKTQTQKMYMREVKKKNKNQWTDTTLPPREGKAGREQSQETSFIKKGSDCIIFILTSYEVTTNTLYGYTSYILHKFENRLHFKFQTYGRMLQKEKKTKNCKMDDLHVSTICSLA